MLLAAFPIVPSLAAVPGVTEISTNGFGDPQNAYSWSMEWFKGKLYVGTTRNPLCVENALIDYYYPGYGLYTATPADGLGCTPDKYDLDLRAEIWQYTPSTSAWKQVYLSPVVDNPVAPGKSIAVDIGYRGMAVVKDFWGNETLVVGGVTAGEYIPELLSIAPPRLLATTDGENFTPLNGAPGDVVAAYGTQEVIGYRGLVAVQNRLFVLASQSYTGDGAVMEVVNPLSANPSFVQISPTSTAVFEFVPFNNALYIGTGAPSTGYEVWKANLVPTGASFSFAPIVTAGAGRGQAMTSVVSMHVFRNRLYVGASGWYSTAFPGSELIRIASDDSWQLVVGNARTLPNGTWMFPISGLPDGYGNVFNAHFWRMADLQGALFMGTNDWSWALRSVPFLNFLLYPQFGYDVYASCDGQYWSLVTRDAFGDGLYNFGARTMLGTPGGGFIGSANHATGTTVWSANTSRLCDTRFPWRQSRDRNANGMATTADGTLPAPTRLLTEVGDSGMVLSWDAVEGAAQYTVMRAKYEATPGFEFVPRPGVGHGEVPVSPQGIVVTNDSANSVRVPGEYVEIGTTTDTFFTDTTASPDDQYDYQVIAKAASGVASEPSNTASSETAAKEVTFNDVRSGIAAAAGRGDLVSGGQQTLMATLKRAEWAVAKGYCNVAAKSLDDLERQVYAPTGNGGRVTSETTREDLGDLIMRLSRGVTYGDDSCS